MLENRVLEQFGLRALASDIKVSYFHLFLSYLVGSGYAIALPHDVDIKGWFDDSNQRY